MRAARRHARVFARQSRRAHNARCRFAALVQQSVKRPQSLDQNRTVNPDFAAPALFGRRF